MRKVRRAIPSDAQGIHEAHRVSAIQNQYVWVVENDGKIEGYGHFGLHRESKEVAHIYGLYFAPEVIGLGFGAQIIRQIINEAKSIGVKELILESTLTAHNFYKKQGFVNSGDQTTIQIGGVGIRCFPMHLVLT